MHKVASALKQHLHLQHETQAVTPPVVQTMPAASFTDVDLYRYRKQRGVNLGSWFVLERWIADAPFQSADGPAQSDLDVARGSHAKEVLERHWDTWITEEDWAWIADRGINTVRLPIGFYHICGVDPTVLQGTNFAQFGHVFEGAWRRITGAIATAHRYGLGVLIDLHAAPGKQNADSHSGSSAEPTFFTDCHNMPHTIHVLSVLLSQLTAFTRSHNPPLPNVVGIELLNEPQPGPHNASLGRWYLDTFRMLRNIDPSIPLYIGDIWQTDQYAEFLSNSGVSFVVLDHHLYRCFTPQDISTPVSQHTRSLSDPNEWAPQMFARVSQKLDGAGGGMIVGEWSCGLNPGSLQGIGDEDSAKREYVQAQLQLYDRYCAGWFFWTYKKQYRDKGWSLRDAVASDVFPSTVGARTNGAVVDDPERTVRRDRARNEASAQHSSHWSQYPGNYEHWRFADGFTEGWEDAWQFFFISSHTQRAGFISELGFKGPWAKRRSREHASKKGSSNVWEYEHGFLQGVAAARVDFERMYC
ncbi:glycoside hydrolase family 5 protein [Daedalea quercina L-15889]|uniref:Glycoside hydrolase family 5 protein n=1 Tax=Daedalea quercina L-15889 TaxID=1314783 RepID=A0A165Q7D4_9APHY|nr:glycoside hydrolase family 5 protein [Daedalea quercina L-15889]